MMCSGWPAASLMPALWDGYSGCKASDQRQCRLHLAPSSAWASRAAWQARGVEGELLLGLLPPDDTTDRNVVLEVRAGAWGVMVRA